MPRPTQKARPPFWIAALATPESFSTAGKLGHAIMAIPLGGAKLRELTDIYRAAWREAGHLGCGRVMLAFHMYCHLQAVAAAASEWTSGLSSKDYVGYDKIIAGLRAETCDSQIAKISIWAGTPVRLREQISAYSKQVGGFEIASLQANFHSLSLDRALASAQLFSEEVMPQFPGA